MKKEIILYHGSDHIIQKPIFGFGSTANDYGRGFYCTKIPLLAKEWACRSEFMDKPLRYSNKYVLDATDLNILDLDEEKDSVLKWLALVLKYRNVAIQTILASYKDKIITNFLPNTSGVDIIEGYRADDRFFSYVKSFVAGSLSLEDIQVAMKLGKLGRQTVLVSNKSFNCIKFIESETVNWEDYHFAAKERERKANDFYNNVIAKNKEKDPEGTYIINILNKLKKDNQKKEEKENGDDEACL